MFDGNFVLWGDLRKFSWCNKSEHFRMNGFEICTVAYSACVCDMREKVVVVWRMIGGRGELLGCCSMEDLLDGVCTVLM